MEIGFLEDSFTMVLPNPKAENCTGLVFKAVENHFIDSRGDYCCKTTMRLMRRKSCKCDKCYGLLDYYSECASEGYYPEMCTLVNGHFYTLGTRVQRDWESGLVDQVDLYFCEIVENIL